MVLHILNHDAGRLTTLKEEIKALLRSPDFEKVSQLAIHNKRVFSILISFTYDKKDLLCWRAIEAVGKAAGAVAEREPLTVRNIVQRILWSMSEESGGIGWSAPEMLGEMVINNPVACADIPPILLSFHEEENFLHGILWAMGRMADAGISSAEGSAEIAIKYIAHKNPSVRGLALYAVSKIKRVETTDKIKDMVYDEGRFTIYENHELREMRVGDFAERVLKSIDEGHRFQDVGSD